MLDTTVVSSQDRFKSVVYCDDKEKSTVWSEADFKERMRERRGD